METGKFIGRALDVLVGPRITGKVLAVHKDPDGARRVIVDRGQDNVVVEQVKSISFGPMRFVTNPQPSQEFKPGDMFDARTSSPKPWVEGERV